MLPHRVANLVARSRSDLLGQPARTKPRFEDPLDGARVEGVVLGACSIAATMSSTRPGPSGA
jgi:hypothetical protein